MTATHIETREETTTGDDDQCSHRFCKTQAQAWLEGQPATARCGKTKHDWQPATGADLLCIVCYESYNNQYCAHCAKEKP